MGVNLQPGDEGPPETASSSNSDNNNNKKSSTGGGGGSSSKDGRATPSAAVTSSNSQNGSSPVVLSAANLPLDTRARFGANLFLLSGIELAHVIMKLEQECPHVLEYVTEEIQDEEDEEINNNNNNNNDSATMGVSAPKLEINVDAIEPFLFEELSSYVLERVGSKGHSDLKVDDVPSSRPKKKKKT